MGFPKRIKIPGHRQARLELERIDSRSGHRRHFSGTHLQAQKARFCEFPRQFRLARLQSHLPHRLRLNAILRDHTIHHHAFRWLALLSAFNPKRHRLARRIKRICPIHRCRQHDLRQALRFFRQGRSREH